MKFKRDIHWSVMILMRTVDTQVSPMGERGDVHCIWSESNGYNHACTIIMIVPSMHHSHNNCVT